MILLDPLADHEETRHPNDLDRGEYHRRPNLARPLFGTRVRGSLSTSGAFEKDGGDQLE